MTYHFVYVQKMWCCSPLNPVLHIVQRGNLLLKKVRRDEDVHLNLALWCYVPMQASLQWMPPVVDFDVPDHLVVVALDMVAADCGLNLAPPFGPPTSHLGTAGLRLAVGRRRRIHTRWSHTSDFVPTAVPWQQLQGSLLAPC